jgi:hypothetical protein
MADAGIEERHPENGEREKRQVLGCHGLRKRKNRELMQQGVTPLLSPLPDYFKEIGGRPLPAADGNSRSCLFDFYFNRLGDDLFIFGDMQGE